MLNTITMKLHSLPSTKTKRSQRVGRGGKRGHTAGRGTKGQRSRAGRRIRPAERDLILRIPKRRGFRNKPKSERTVVFDLTTLSKKLKSFATSKVPVEISRDMLRVAGMLGKNFNGTVKILGDGDMAFAISVKGIGVSKSAKKKIEKAGGSVVV